MEDLPVELALQVFTLACSCDDGRTYRALSLVSKSFRAFATPFKYLTLSLSSSSRIRTVLDELEHFPSCICHLYISADANVKHTALYRQKLHTMHTLLSELFAIVSPSLRTLSIAIPTYGSSLITQLFFTPFPQLESLSIAGFYSFPRPMNDGERTWSNMPKLKTLNLAGNRNPYGLLEDGFGEACPALKHLRISGLEQPTSFLREMNEVLGLEREESVSRLPPLLETVQMQYATLQTCGDFKEGLQMPEDGSGRLKSLTHETILSRELPDVVLKREWTLYLMEESL